jgi:hypothetical protein
MGAHCTRGLTFEYLIPSLGRFIWLDRDRVFHLWKTPKGDHSVALRPVFDGFPVFRF